MRTAIVVKLRCAGCNTLHAYRTLRVTAAGVRCEHCVPLTGRDQVQARRRIEAERKALRSAA